MKAVLAASFGILLSYTVWACKVRVGETSSTASAESDLDTKAKHHCAASANQYPKFYDVSLDAEHAALKFTLEDKDANGALFKYVYFTHATKYYKFQSQDVQYYSLRLGDNMIDIEASAADVKKIYYKGKGAPQTLTCLADK